MAQVWMLEILKGAGKIFINPLFYYLLFVSLLLGLSRVKREREQFHTRVHHGLLELRVLLWNGLLPGLVVSIFLVVIGAIIPTVAIILFVLFTILFSFTMNLRLVSPTMIVGFTFFLLVILANQSTMSIPIFRQAFTSLETMYPAVALLLAFLLITESVLIIKNGAKDSSPRLTTSPRGQHVGVHEMRKLWMVPVFLFVPSGTLEAPFSWWPLFPIGDGTYSLLLVPFAIGLYQQCKGSMPTEITRALGKRIFAIGLITLGMVGGSYFLPILAIVAVAFAIVAREIVYQHQRMRDDAQPFFFSKRNKGLMILGVLPHTPAAKMGLKIGETITKANGMEVEGEIGFYKALQHNSAHCKLEVLDVNNEIRFVQRALYEGEHHELGLLFVQGKREWGEVELPTGS